MKKMMTFCIISLFLTTGFIVTALPDSDPGISTINIIQNINEGQIAYSLREDIMFNGPAISIMDSSQVMIYGNNHRITISEQSPKNIQTVFISNSDNVLVRDLVFDIEPGHNKNAFYLTNVRDSEISGNKIVNNAEYGRGIILTHSDSVEVNENKIQTSGLLGAI